MKKRKWIIEGLISLGLFLCLTGIVTAYTGNGATIVYITRTGECYHRAKCSYLKSSIEITLEEAYIRGYRPCSKCNPPTYSGTAIRMGDREKNDSDSSSVNRGYINSEGDSQERTTGKIKTIWKMVCLVTGTSVAGWVFAQIWKYQKERKKEQERKQLLKEKRASEKADRLCLYTDKYKGKSIDEIVSIPSGYKIVDNGIAMGEISQKYPNGDLTVFLPQTGKYYHNDMRCRGCSFWTRTDQFHARLKGYQPCPHCRKNDDGEVPEWYRKLIEESVKKEELESEFE